MGSRCEMATNSICDSTGEAHPKKKGGKYCEDQVVIMYCAADAEASHDMVQVTNAHFLIRRRRIS